MTTNKKKLTEEEMDESIGSNIADERVTNERDSDAVNQPAVQQPSLQTASAEKLKILQKGYTDPLEETIDTLYDRIINQKEFTYDVKGDPAYSQYAENYKRNAALMSEDTMAQAAALTGGIGSSYAQKVASQAYNEQMSHLNDIVPELRERARSEWKDDRARDIEALSMLLNERNYDRSVFESDRAFEEGVRQYDENMKAKREEAALDRERTISDRNEEREILAAEAGYKSWAEYLKAVQNGEIKDETKADLEIPDSFTRKAVDAFMNDGEKGIARFFYMYGNKYSDEQLSELGEEILEAYAEDAAKGTFDKVKHAFNKITAAQAKK